MAADSNSYVVRLVRWLKFFSQRDGWLLIFGGAAVLLGWSFGIEPLKRVFPGFVAMNPVTAVGFMIGGASLLCFWQIEKVPLPATIAGRALAGILVIFGALKLCEFGFGWHLSFDQIFFRSQHFQGIDSTNQIAPNTAFDFFLSGLALWLLNARGQRFSRYAQNISLVLLFVSLVPVVGYIYHANSLYSVGSFPMALNTAVLFCALAAGILFAQMESGIIAIFTGETLGGAIARRLLPFAFGVPFVLGAVAILGRVNKLYPAELGVSIVVVGSFAAFTGLIWWNAVSLNRADEKRREAEQNLQKGHDELEARIAERTTNLRQTNEALQAQILLQQKAEEKIREQARLLDEARDAILVLDMEHRVTYWNKGAERVYGWTAKEMVGKNADDVLFAANRPAGFSNVFETGAWSGELQQLTKSEKPMVMESSWTLVKDETGKPRCILIINTNVTEQKNYQAQLWRSQRMESLGALAGGIAHDLNNALAPVIMGADLLRQGQNDRKSQLLLDTILASARRGTEMVKQILSFVRGSQSRSGPVQIHTLVKEMTKILGDTFPKFIDIQSNLDLDLWATQGDVTELHQVLLNLCVNARDAMPSGGIITLAAENVTLNAQTIPRKSNAGPGSYVMISVSDTGTGIPPEILPRIFEPFFTTKAPDKGTGLGLSTVSSIVKSHNGFMDIQTEAGKGTCFKIYLPAVRNADAVEDKAAKPAPPPGHGELIMVVDDEQAVRELTKTALENYGYRVVTASNGFLGITCFEQYIDEIAVVVSDTDMPYANGLEAVRSMQQLKPNVRIIIASGGKRNAELFEEIDMTRLTEIQKPYTVEQLLMAVADAIKGAKASTAASPSR